jgi:hypothetical protein
LSILTPLFIACGGGGLCGKKEKQEPASVGVYVLTSGRSSQKGFGRLFVLLLLLKPVNDNRGPRHVRKPQ